MSVRSNVLNAALLGLTLGTSASTLAADSEKKNAAPAATTEVEKCYGINTCHANTKCSVSKADVEATKEVFKDKFAKTETHSCAGSGKCAASIGQLAWVEVPKGTCKKSGGFMIETKGGKKVVVK